MANSKPATESARRSGERRNCSMARSGGRKDQRGNTVLRVSEKLRPRWADRCCGWLPPTLQGGNYRHELARRRGPKAEVAAVEREAHFTTLTGLEVQALSKPAAPGAGAFKTTGAR